MLRVLQALADFAARAHPEQLDRILNQIAGAVPRLTPDLVVTLITTGVPQARREPGDRPRRRGARIDCRIAPLANSWRNRCRGIRAQPLDSPKRSRRSCLTTTSGLSCWRWRDSEAENLPIGRQPEFPDLWKSAAELLTSYTDSTFVSDEYGRELAGARVHAIEVERVSDDPPERMSAWLSTVGEPEVRRLDQQVLLDLLTIEKRPDAWRGVLESALGSIEHLVLVGNISLAQQLLDPVARRRRQQCLLPSWHAPGLDRLRTGPVMKNVVMHVRQATGRRDGHRVDVLPSDWPGRRSARWSRRLPANKVRRSGVSAKSC